MKQKPRPRGASPLVRSSKSNASFPRNESCDNAKLFMSVYRRLCLFSKTQLILASKDAKWFTPRRDYLKILAARRDDYSAKQFQEIWADKTLYLMSGCRGSSASRPAISPPPCLNRTATAPPRYSFRIYGVSDSYECVQPSFPHNGKNVSTLWKTLF